MEKKISHKNVKIDLVHLAAFIYEEALETIFYYS